MIKVVIDYIQPTTDTIVNQSTMEKFTKYIQKTGSPVNELSVKGMLSNMITLHSWLDTYRYLNKLKEFSLIK